MPTSCRLDGSMDLEERRALLQQLGVKVTGCGGTDERRIGIEWAGATLGDAERAAWSVDNLCLPRL